MSRKTTDADYYDRRTDSADRTSLDEDRIDFKDIDRLHSEGLSLLEIAEELGHFPPTVAQAFGRLGLDLGGDRR